MAPYRVYFVLDKSILIVLLLTLEKRSFTFVEEVVNVLKTAEARRLGSALVSPRPRSNQLHILGLQSHSSCHLGV